jgi:hypothetical protein
MTCLCSQSPIRFQRPRTWRLEVALPYGHVVRPFPRCLSPGDAVLYRADPTPLDRVIELTTHSIWIHAGMLAWDDDQAQWEILDTRAWHGARRTPLFQAVQENPGHWDHFRANAGERWPGFSRAAAVAMADEYLNRPYGWLSLLRDGLAHLPLPCNVLPARDLRYGAEEGDLPFCSQLLAICWLAGGVNAFPHLPPERVEPVHVAQSLFCEYAGTFWPEPEDDEDD